MKRKRDGLTPQARHHFTRFDQIDRLCAASESVPDLAFLHRVLALCSLPRTDPGNCKEYARSNGPYTLGMIAGLHNKLPYGSLPRLVLVWICSEATRTQSPELLLGDSLSDFMRELGMEPVGGARTRIRNQMDRLFNASVSLIYEHNRDKATVNAQIATRTEFWWNERKPDERTLWQSKVRLSEEFFNEIIQHPVPVDMNILKGLKRSPLGLDYYVWLVYRTFMLSQSLNLTWPQLYRQFGSNPAKAGDNVTVQNFRKRSLRELKKIKAAWPDLNYATSEGVLVLRPSPPSILPFQIPLLPR